MSLGKWNEGYGDLPLAAAAQCEESRELRKRCRALLHRYREDLNQFRGAVADLDAALSGRLWTNRDDPRPTGDDA
ncbi:MAG TPA: hypothetical protein VGN57_17315 [Pirellulaceae bacterium]|jgi:hypothetical protein|nr:hypothetical protein [Pirellulaceae bacterium]